MNFKRLESFVWVATLGSFAKAAEKQHTTQPNISSRIAALEDELGVRLFSRDTGPGKLKLTAKGSELLPYAEKILYMSDQMRSSANTDETLSGILRLGVSETIVHTWLPKFLARLHSDMPKIYIELTVDVTSNLRLNLLDHSLDAAFLMGPMSDPTIINLPLNTFPLAWIASPQLGLPPKATLKELAQWPIITYARGTKPFAEISQQFHVMDGEPVRLFSSSSLAACHRLALDGFGVSSLPQVMVEKEIKRGKLLQIESQWAPSPLSFTASYPQTPFNPIAESASKLAVEVVGSINTH